MVIFHTTYDDDPPAHFLALRAYVCVCVFNAIRLAGIQKISTTPTRDNREISISDNTKLK